MRSFLLALSLGLSTAVFAHEGHDATPGAVAAPHGGKVLSLPEMYLEVVKSDGAIKVYPLTHELKSIPTSEIKLSVKVELPKQKKASADVSAANDSWTIVVESKGAHRYTLFLNTEWKRKKGSTKYTVEK